MIDNISKIEYNGKQITPEQLRELVKQHKDTE